MTPSQLTGTHTVTTLQVSKAAYNEIAELLARAGYRNLIGEDGMIDMTNIGVVRVAKDPEAVANDLRVSTCPNCGLSFADMELHDAGLALKKMNDAKDNAYWERNCVVAMVARLAARMGARVGIARTDIPGWSPDWHNCVYIDLPTGQVSWHYHDSHTYLFSDLPQYSGGWDGHDTPEKYRRVKAAFHPVTSETVLAKRLTALLDAFAKAAGEVSFYVMLQPKGANYRNTPEYLSLRRKYDDAWDNVIQLFMGA